MRAIARRLQGLFFEIDPQHGGGYVNYGIRMWVSVVGAVLALAVVAGGILGVAEYVEYHSCQIQAENIRLPERWNFFAGCQVQLPDGRVVSIDSVRFNEQGKLEPNA